jgi:hypothetical protein
MVIDVLAKQSFTILRRETNLEWAQLDGEADLAAGKALLPEIAATFAEWGMPAPAATAALGRQALPA